MGDRKNHLATEDCCLEEVVKQEVLEVGVLVKCLLDVAKEYTANPRETGNGCSLPLLPFSMPFLSPSHPLPHTPPSISPLSSLLPSSVPLPSSPPSFSPLSLSLRSPPLSSLPLLHHPPPSPSSPASSSSPLPSHLRMMQPPLHMRAIPP